MQTATVLVVGCGGSGAAVAHALAYLDATLRALGHPGLAVTLMDGDLVSASNLVRQPFVPADVGRHKAIVLAERINTFRDVAWGAIPRFLGADERADHEAMRWADIVISCVDTREARARMWAGLRRAAYMSTTRYWLDLGNDATSGQFVLGAVPGGDIARKDWVPLPSLADKYPELLDASLDDPDDGPSCSAAEAIARQGFLVNHAVAIPAVALLGRFFREGGLRVHGGVVNLASGVMAPMRVPPVVPRPRRGTRRARGGRTPA